jgi:chromosome segregation ATPase
MSLKRSSLIVATAIFASLMWGCAEETSQVKLKVAELENRLQKQEKDLKDFTGKFSLPRDFSADIQRIEDQQDRVAQVIKTKVDPVNVKLEEFRDWAQEAQKERDDVKSKLKALEDALAELEKRTAEGLGQVNRIGKAYATERKNLATVAKTQADLTKALEQTHKEIAENNAKIVEAVKKTLPKVKDAAVAELKDRFTPLEKGLATLKSEVENDRKAVAAVKPQPQAPQPDDTKAIQALQKRLRDMEEILTSHKTYLLEVGAKVHELELQLRRSLGAEGRSGESMSRR